MDFGAFLSGCIASKNRDVGLLAIAPSDRLGTLFYALVGHDWVRYSLEVDWAAVGMAAHRYSSMQDLLVVAVSSEGDWWELTPGTSTQQTGRVPDDLSGVTRVARVGEEIWLCGMGRMVWARDAAGRWRDISAPPAPPEEGVIGFTALGDLDGGVAIAAGWRGEIWVRDAAGWHQEDSGTNSNFNAISVDADGNVVVVGDRGVLVEGHPGQWSVHSTGASFNLQGVCHFDGQVFVCNDFEIFLWKNGVLMRDTRFSTGDRPATCMNLMAGVNTVLSQGERDVFRFEDGRWARVV